MERTIRNNFWIEFIELFKSKPELWKIKSEAYKNVNLKKEAYEELMIKLCEICPTADIDMVKRKLRAIKTGFKMELKKARESIKFGDSADKDCLPSWSYFRHLSFLADQEDDETIDNGCVLCSEDACLEYSLLCYGEPPRDRRSLRNETEEIQLDAIEYAYDNISKNKNLGEKCLVDDAEYGVALTPDLTQSQSGSSSEKMDKKNPFVLRVSEVETCHKDDTEPELFGKCWALEYTKLDAEQKIYAKKAIDEILFHGRFGRLTEYSTKILLEKTVDKIAPKSQI